MENNNVRLTLIDGPTLLIEIGGLRLLTDPAFDPPQSYDSAGATIVKQAGPPVGPEELGNIDAVLLSHDQHLDNLDYSGRAFLPTVDRVITTIAGASRLGGNASGPAHWQSTKFPLLDGRVLTVTGTPARHGPAGAGGEDRRCHWIRTINRLRPWGLHIWRHGLVFGGRGGSQTF
jgi:L-ascorbate metabolism protein UlaG (beta-lactamase superfamily)